MNNLDLILKNRLIECLRKIQEATDKSVEDKFHSLLPRPTIELAINTLIQLSLFAEAKSLNQQYHQIANITNDILLGHLTNGDDADIQDLQARFGPIPLPNPDPQLNAEIDNDRLLVRHAYVVKFGAQIASLLTQIACPSFNGFLGANELFPVLGIHETRRDAFRKQLDRSRTNLGDTNWQEVGNPGKGKPKYLYRDCRELRELAERYRSAITP